MANGTIAFDTLSTSGQISGTAVSVDADYLAYGSAKVWASLDGTGTAALRDSFNTTSITDNGTGDYTFTFNNDFSNRNRAVSMTNNAGENGTLGYQVSEIQTPTTGLTRVGGAQADNSAGDQETVYVIAHGDLA